MFLTVVIWKLFSAFVDLDSFRLSKYPCRRYESGSCIWLARQLLDSNWIVLFRQKMVDLNCFLSAIDLFCQGRPTAVCLGWSSNPLSFPNKINWSICRDRFPGGPTCYWCLGVLWIGLVYICWLACLLGCRLYLLGCALNHLERNWTYLQ